MTNNAQLSGIGVILAAVSMVLGIYVLPIVDSAVADYANGDDDVLAGTSTDDPKTSNVNLLGLGTIALIFMIVLLAVGGIASVGAGIYGTVQSVRNKGAV